LLQAETFPGEDWWLSHSARQVGEGAPPRKPSPHAVVTILPAVTA
jgi:hypothetical protein